MKLVVIHRFIKVTLLSENLFKITLDYLPNCLYYHFNCQQLPVQATGCCCYLMQLPICISLSSKNGQSLIGLPIHSADYAFLTLYRFLYHLNTALLLPGFCRPPSEDSGLHDRPPHVLRRSAYRRNQFPSLVLEVNL